MIELINGDCFEEMDKLIERGIRVDLVFTNPPYNRKRNDKYNNYDDANCNYYEMIEKTIEMSLKISDVLFLNIQKNYYNKKDVFKIIGNYSDKIVDIIVWSKSNPMPANGFNITNAYEFIIILSNNKSVKATKTYTKNHVETSVYSDNPFKKIHRAVMKPALCEWVLDRFTKEGDLILDCYMGCGTTGDICANTNRNFIGIELNKEYFNIAQKRIERVGDKND